MLESELEAFFREHIKHLGGKAFKWVSPGNPGVPDRIVIYKGRVVFAELKQEKGTVSAVQKLRISELACHGAEVYIIRTKGDVLALIDALHKGVVCPWLHL